MIQLISWNRNVIFQAILDEIRHYSADIISLQEIETDQFYNFFKPELKNDGYDGIFSPKSRAKTMGENERKYVDGCAIFFRAAKWVFYINATQLLSLNAANILMAFELCMKQVYIDQRPFNWIQSTGYGKRRRIW